MVVAAVVAAILAPILARLLYLACSRKREYLADASAARFTRFPDGLASALEKIAMKAGGAKDVSSTIAPLYIINPLQLAARGSRWFSTHPPTNERVKILRSMGGGAGFADYESAFRKLRGSSEKCLGARSLTDKAKVRTRKPSVEKETKEQVIERAREAAEIVDRMAEYLMIACVCGVRIKLPPEWKRPSISCPRCGVDHKVPHAEPGGVPAGAGKSEESTASHEASTDGAGTVRKATSEQAGAEVAAEGPMRYVRQGTGWEAFKCGCGSAIQISPSLRAKRIGCARCKRSYEILEKEPEPVSAEA